MAKSPPTPNLGDDDVVLGASRPSPIPPWDKSPQNAEPTSHDEAGEVVPPWEKPSQEVPATKSFDELFEERVRQAAKEYQQERAKESPRPPDDDKTELLAEIAALTEPLPGTSQADEQAGEMAAPADRPAATDAQAEARQAAEKPQPVSPPEAPAAADAPPAGEPATPTDTFPPGPAPATDPPPTEPTAEPQSEPDVAAVGAAEPQEKDSNQVQALVDRIQTVRPALVVRYGALRNIGLFRHSLEDIPAAGTKVIVRTERGVELGKVVTQVADEPQTCGTCRYTCIHPLRLGKFIVDNGPNYPLKVEGKVLRIANSQDTADQREIQRRHREEMAYCRTQIRELNLQMHLITVEHLAGGERLVFYFAADHRVDFRALVRRLTAKFHTRVELRQVGARDEARLVADYERCGRRCCCQQFLKYLQPVAMRMAKVQKATLDPSKISGRCSRLMCCLRYEDQGYQELRKNLPKKNTWLRTEQLIGRVIETQTLTQLVHVVLPDQTHAVITIEEIVERNCPEPEIPKAPPRRVAREEHSEPTFLRNLLVANKGQNTAPGCHDRPAEAEPSAVETEPPPQTADKQEQGRGRSRRRRQHKRKKPSPQAQSAAPAGDSDDARKAQPSGTSKKRRRRRRK